MRTWISLAGGSVLLVRLSIERRPWLAVAFAVVAVSALSVTGATAWHRYRRAGDALQAAGALPDATLPCGITVVTVAIGVTALSLLLLR